MTVSIPTTEPTSWVAADTVSWVITLSDYPADVYTLSYAFVSPTLRLAVTCSASGLSHLATLTTTTSNIAAGTYRWQRYATNGSTRYFTGQGTTEVITNFGAASSGYDSRTDAEKMLDALNAILVGKAGVDQLAMTIQGRSLTRLSPAELISWRNKMKGEVARERREERAALGLDLGNKVRTRF